MGKIINGYDLDTTKGQYEYLLEELVLLGASSTVLSVLEKLYENKVNERRKLLMSFLQWYKDYFPENNPNEWAVDYYEENYEIIIKQQKEE